ncbi:MAG TPA: pectate lyase, partial [Hyphomonas atlantica]|nr:pectate lyase [Hyphomonas atlantica]
MLAIMSLAGCATAQTTTASTAPATFETATPAAPWMGPLGPASTTVGGKGGQIVKVTNLDSAGPGSLREALQAEG